jgi:regulator-associated protein of mTOR
MGAPAIYVFDCSGAGHLLQTFMQFAEQRDNEMMQQQQKQPVLSASQQSDLDNAGALLFAFNHSSIGRETTSTALMRDCIQLAACSADQVLPMNPDMPADIFTSCLTTPIEMALRFFCSTKPTYNKRHVRYDQQSMYYRVL